MIRMLLDGVGPEAAAEGALRVLSRDPAGAETARSIEHALALAKEPAAHATDDIARLGEGWIAEEALAIGLYAAMRAHDFREAIRIAANHDGDSDSTASIAGQIHGAANGLAGISNSWVRRLDVLDPLLTLAADLSSLSTPNTPLLRAYPPN
jgi:ADP-ribosylglycohydrolase